MEYRNLKAMLAAGTALWAFHASSAFAQTQAASPSPPGGSPPTGPATPPPQGNPPVPLPSRSASTPPGVGEIIVSARRLDERLQDVPISITVFNQQQLNNRNITQALDLAAYTPSLSTDTFFGSNNSTFSIRGFTQQTGTSPTVGVYFGDVIAPRAASNDIPIGDGAGPGSFFDLQNVQVLKGPQGTLFGLNTTGGAILLVPQKPTGKYEGYIEVSGGDYGLTRIQAVVNIPIDDNVRFRIGVDHESREGYLTNTTGIGPNHFNDMDYTAARASIIVDIAPNIENYAIFSYLISNTNGDLSKVIATDPSQLLGQLEQTSLTLAPKVGFYSTQNTLDTPSTQEQQWQIIDNISWHATDHMLVKDIISYAQLKENIKSALFGTDLDLHNFAPYSGLYPAGYARIGIADVYPAPGGATGEQSTFTNEVQLQGDALDNRLTYQGGVYFEQSDPLGLAGSQADNIDFCTTPANLNCANPLLSGSTSVTEGKTSYTDVGVYVQSSYSLTRQLKFTGGFRYTWDDTSTSGSQYAYGYNSPLVNPALALYPNPPITRYCQNPDSTLPACAIAYKESSSAPTALADLDYKPINNLLLYAKYSLGYREGGISPAVPTEYATFQPEHLNAYEAGLKTTFHGPIRGTFDLAGFYDDFADEQVQATFLPKVAGALPEQSGTVNASKSRSYGLETESSITPFAGLTMEVAYTYLNAKILSIPAIATSANSPYYAQAVARNGDPEELSPQNKATLAVTYELPLSADIGHILIGGDLTYTDKLVTNYANRNAAGQLTSESYLPSTTLLNFDMNWKSVFREPFDLSIFITNATNLGYYTNKGGTLPQVGFDTAGVGPPRMFGVRLRYHFGR